MAWLIGGCIYARLQWLNLKHLQPAPLDPFFLFDLLITYSTLNTMSSSSSDKAPQRETRRGEEKEMKEYFVPSDGIDLVVITADLARYLGEGATVRVGTYKVTQMPPIVQKSI